MLQKPGSHCQLVDHEGADNCHFYFGEDLFIIYGPAEIRVDPIEQELFFLNLPVRIKGFEFKTDILVLLFGITGGI